MEQLPNEQNYTDEKLRDKIVELNPRGDWQILGFIEPAKPGEEKRVLIKSLTIKRQSPETMNLSQLIEGLESGIWKIVDKQK